MSERLKFMGRRQELEIEKKNLEIRIRGLISNIRDHADPLAKVEDLKTDAIVALSLELADAQDRLKEVLAELKRIQDLLGR